MELIWNPFFNLTVQISQYSKAGCFGVALLFVLFVPLMMKLNPRETKTNKKHGVKVGLEVIPGPKPFFIKFVGNVYDFLPLKEFLSKTLAWHKMYDPCMKMCAANYNLLIVFSAEIAKPLLKSKDFGHVSKKGMPLYEIWRPFLGNAAFISEGEHWQFYRNMMMKTVSFKALRSYMNVLNKHSKRLVTNLENIFDGKTQEHQINFHISSCLLAIIMEILSGIDVNKTDNIELSEYHHSLDTWKSCMAFRMENFWYLFEPLWKLHPKYKVHNKAVENMNSFMKRRLEERKLNKDNSKNFQSILDEMLNAGESEKEILDQLNAMVFGGHETNATTIHFFLFYMALNPQVQERCRAEIDQVFEDPLQTPDGNMTFESLTSLKYVERCLLEILRLYPPGFVFIRTLQESLNIEYNGKSVEVPVDTSIIVAPWVIHRNSKYYPNPEQFNPDRFLPEECAKRHPYSFLAFSAGARSCIGRKFSLNGMKTIAAHILRNFELCTTDKLENVPLLPHVTVTLERDFYFLLKKRKNL